MRDDDDFVTKKPININKLVPINTNTGLTTDLNGKKGKEIIEAMWDIDQTMASQVANFANVFSSPYGMFRSVPIICRENDCPYIDVCMVAPSNRKKGSRCPMEIATILSRFQQWCEHFDITIIDDVIASKDLVDATLIKDLVTIEVQQMRGENKIAINGDFMTTTLLDIDRKCNAYYGSVVSPEAEYLLNLQQKKDKILTQLNATRKDKAQEKNRSNPSDDAMKIFQEIKNLEKNMAKSDISISDVEFDDDGNIIQHDVETVQEETVQDETVQNETVPNGTVSNNGGNSLWDSQQKQ